MTRVTRAASKRPALAPGMSVADFRSYARRDAARIPGHRPGSVPLRPVRGRAPRLRSGAAAYFGLLVARGYYERSLQSIAVAVVVVVIYGGMLAGVLPRNDLVSWEAHLLLAFLPCYSAPQGGCQGTHGKEV